MRGIHLMDTILKAELSEMKKTILLLAIALAPATFAGSNYLNYDQGMLLSQTEVSFRGGAGHAQLSNGESFRIRGLGDKVEFYGATGQNWTFDSDTIYADSISLVDPLDFDDENVGSIIGSAWHANNQHYEISFIKIPVGKQEIIRIIRVESVFPEFSSASLATGCVGMFYVMIKRRRAK